MFYNCSAYAKAEDEQVSNVLEFIYNLKAKSKFTKRLQDSVIRAKTEPVFKDEYMYFEDILEEEKELAAEEAVQKNTNEHIIALLKEGLPCEQISRCFNVSIERVQELAEQIN